MGVGVKNHGDLDLTCHNDLYFLGYIAEIVGCRKLILSRDISLGVCI